MLAWSCLVLAAAAAAEPFELHPGFEGTWQGIPHESVVGPWSENFTFSISRLQDQDYVFEALLPFDAAPEFREFWSWQRSYLKVSGEDRGRLLHCPGPRSPQLRRVAMMQGHLGEDLVTFCLRKWPGYVDAEHPFPFRSLGCYSLGPLEGCGCFNWTLRLSETTLDYEVSMAAGSRHLAVKLQRVGPGTAVSHFPGDFDCDYGGRDGVQTPLSRCPFAQAYATVPQAPVASGYPNCYQLDLKTQLVLEWQLQGRTLEVRISAHEDFDYVAIGFRPWGGASTEAAYAQGTGRERRFGMAGADIVLGHGGGVERYYAESYAGAPVVSEALEISNAAVERREGRIYLHFRRDVVGGWLQKHGVNASITSGLADMLWAVGQWDQRHGAPKYHSFRGWREVNWTDPEYDSRPLLSLRPYRCTEARILP